MTLHQFDHLDEELQDMLLRLSEVAERTFEVTGNEAARLGEAIWRHGVLNPYPVLDGIRDPAALERVESALLEINRALSDDVITDRAAEIFVWNLKNVDGGDRRNSDAIWAILDRFDQFRKAIFLTKEHIKKSPLTKKSPSKLNVEAINLVGACQFVWTSLGYAAPEVDLNPASTFAQFLGDVFEACGVLASPRAAFKAWAREKSKVHTSA